MPKKSNKKEVNVQERLKEICEAYSDEILQILLDTPFWPKGLTSETPYQRYDDDTRLGHLTIYFSPDGDAWVDVLSQKDPTDPYSHRFRTYFGCGQSLRVRNALLFLAMAIELDNKEHPQDRQ